MGFGEDFKKDILGGLKGSVASKAKEAKAAGPGNRPVVRVVKLKGMIADGGGGPMQKGTLNRDSLRGTLTQAFNAKGRVDAIALVINSPGGSPVQSALIANDIRRLSKEKDVPVFSFVEDVAASGGYWLACAGDEIYAMPSSVTGSIGVISAGWGFDKLIEKFGIERRVHTAGKNKSQNDPFQPEDPANVKHHEEIMTDMHEDFKDWVKERRAGKLTESEDKLMDGSYWTSKKSKQYGLIDDIGDMEDVLRDKFGQSVQIEYPQPPAPNLMKMLMGGGLGAYFAQKAGLQAQSPANIGAEIVDRAADRAEIEVAYKRYGVDAPKF